VVHDGGVLRFIIVGNLGGDDGAAAAHRFRVKLGILLARAGFDQRADQSTGNAAASRTRCQSGQPAGRHYRTDAGNGDHAQASRGTCRASNNGAQASAGGGTLSAVFLAVAVLPAMAGNDPVLAVDEHCVYKAKLFYASGDLLDLATAMSPRVARPWLQLCWVSKRDFHPRRPGVYNSNVLGSVIQRPTFCVHECPRWVKSSHWADRERMTALGVKRTFR